MRRFVDGVECELEPGAASVVSLSDGRLIVRTAEGAESAAAVRQGDTVWVSYRGRQYRVEKKPVSRAANRGTETGEIVAPMPGLIVDVMVLPDEVVKAGQKLLVLEAMKTQQPFRAPFDGVVRCLDGKVGDQVVEGQRLILVEPMP